MQLRGVEFGTVAVQARQILDQDVEALPFRRVAVAVEHDPVQLARVLRAPALAQRPAGLVGGVNDVVRLRAVLHEPREDGGHLQVGLRGPQGLEHLGHLGQRHVVERPGGGRHAQVHALGLVQFAQRGEGVAPGHQGLPLEVVLRVPLGPTLQLVRGGLVVLQGVAAERGAVLRLRSVHAHGVVLGILREKGSGLVVLPGIEQRDGQPVAHLGDHDVVRVLVQPILELRDGRIEPLLHGQGKRQVKLDARALRVLREALQQLAHLDLGLFEPLRIDVGLGAQEGHGRHVGPGDRRGRLTGRRFPQDPQHGGLVIGPPRAQLVLLGVRFPLLELLEHRLDTGPVRRRGRRAGDPGQAGLHQLLRQVLAPDLDDRVKYRRRFRADLLPLREDLELPRQRLPREVGRPLADARHLDLRNPPVRCLFRYLPGDPAVGRGAFHEVQLEDVALVAVLDGEGITPDRPGVPQPAADQLLPGGRRSGRRGEHADRQHHSSHMEKGAHGQSLFQFGS